MNIILLEENELQQSLVTLKDRRAEHIVKILRSEVGDLLRVGVVDGAMGQGRVVALKSKFPFAVELDVHLREKKRPQPLIDLLLAMPRPIMLRRIFSQVTALGVGTIHLVNANRVEKSFWDSGLLHDEEYRPLLVQGLEQCVDTRLPEVILHRRFKPFIEDYFLGQKQRYRALICAHPLGAHQLTDAISSGQGRTLMAIGPEGGWVDYEVQKFQEQGFYCCGLGERILKVDTSVIALHSAIQVLQKVAGKSMGIS